MRAGSSGNFQVNPSNFPMETPGRQTGTLILVPDPNLAYTDPAIKAIWNGTLEFPTQSTTAPLPKAAQQENGSEE